jgi:hypothetical protein
LLHCLLQLSQLMQVALVSAYDTLHMLLLLSAVLAAICLHLLVQVSQLLHQPRAGLLHIQRVLRQHTQRWCTRYWM